MSLTYTVYLFAAPLEKGLPRLLEKIVGTGLRCVLTTHSDAALAHIDTYLWTYTPLSFLPHGLDTGLYPEEQPIVLTASAATLVTPPNGATVAIVVDTFSADTFAALQQGPYERIILALPPDVTPEWKGLLPPQDWVCHQQTPSGAWDRL